MNLILTNTMNLCSLLTGGKSRRDYYTMLPPWSFINAELFPDLDQLAAFITFLGDNLSFYLRLQEWRKHFQVLNEHGYFKSPTRHFCRICEALNYNDLEPKIYYDMGTFWDRYGDCRVKEPKITFKEGVPMPIFHNPDTLNSL